MLVVEDGEGGPRPLLFTTRLSLSFRKVSDFYCQIKQWPEHPRVLLEKVSLHCRAISGLATHGDENCRHCPVSVPKFAIQYTFSYMSLRNISPLFFLLHGAKLHDLAFDQTTCSHVFSSSARLTRYRDHTWIIFQLTFLRLASSYIVDITSSVSRRWALRSFNGQKINNIIKSKWRDCTTE